MIKKLIFSMVRRAATDPELRRQMMEHGSKGVAALKMWLNERQRGQSTPENGPSPRGNATKQKNAPGK